MAAKKRSKLQRERDLVIAQEMYLQGYNQYDIAAKLGVSQGQVSQDLKEVKERYKDELMDTREVYVREQLYQLRMVKKNAWEGYWKSKEDIVKLSIETRMRNGEEEEEGGDTVRETKTVEGRIPASQFLQIILNCQKIECELLGLVDAKGSPVLVTIDWEKLTMGLDLSKPVPDRIEQEILELEAKIVEQD